MRPIKKIFTTICVILCINSCASFVNTNTPTASQDYESVKIEKESKKDITFSVSIYTQTMTTIEIEQTYVAKQIKQRLKDTKLFNKITWVSKENASSNHYHFDVKIVSANESDRTLMILLSTITFACIPTWITTYVDTSMFVIKNNTEVYSATAPATITDVVWLPFIIFSPVANHTTAKSSLFQQDIDYFINEIITNKLY